MKSVHFFLAAFFCLTALVYAAEDSAVTARIREQIEVQTREMSAVGVPPEAARNMLMEMHQNRWTKENRVKAQKVVMNCAKAGLPPEPVMSKAMEGMAKQAQAQQVVMAMEAVQSRYAYAHRLALSLSDDKKTTDTLTGDIADSMAAGMRVEDMDAVMTQLMVQTQNQQQTTNQAEQNELTIQTVLTVRTMARLGVPSSEVADTVGQALQHRYTYREMKQLRHQIAKQSNQATPQQIASQHAGAIGKGGDSGNAGDGAGSGPGGGGSGSGGSGSGGSGSGGSGSGGSGSGAGGDGSGSGGGGGPGPGGTK